MVDKPSVRIDYGIVCDDIRQENNGKLFIIGVYSGDILLRDFPNTLNLAMLLHGQATADCSIAIEVRYRAEFAEEEPYEVKAQGEMQINNTEITNEFYAPLPRVPIQCRGPGKLLIAYRIDGKRWKPLLKKIIRSLDS